MCKLNSNIKSQKRGKANWKSWLQTNKIIEKSFTLYKKFLKDQTHIKVIILQPDGKWKLNTQKCNG